MALRIRKIIPGRLVKGRFVANPNVTKAQKRKLEKLERQLHNAGVSSILTHHPRLKASSQKRIARLRKQLADYRVKLGVNPRRRKRR